MKQVLLKPGTLDMSNSNALELPSLNIPSGRTASSCHNFPTLLNSSTFSKVKSDEAEA